MLLYSRSSPRTPLSALQLVSLDAPSLLLAAVLFLAGCAESGGTKDSLESDPLAIERPVDESALRTPDTAPAAPKMETIDVPRYRAMLAQLPGSPGASRKAILSAAKNTSPDFHDAVLGPCLVEATILGRQMEIRLSKSPELPKMSDAALTIFQGCVSMETLGVCPTDCSAVAAVGQALAFRDGPVTELQP